MMILTKAILIGFLPLIFAFTCPESGIFPDPEDCSKFYHCANGIGYHKSCSNGLLFNPVSFTCDWDFNVDCQSSVTTTTTATTMTTISTTQAQTDPLSTTTTGTTATTTISVANQSTGMTSILDFIGNYTYTVLNKAIY